MAVLWALGRAAVLHVGGLQPADGTRPFDRARTTLVLGEHLRRTRRRIDAGATVDQGHAHVGVVGHCVRESHPMAPAPTTR